MSHQPEASHPGPGSYKEAPAPVAAPEAHHPHHPHPGPPPTQHLQHPRPSSIVHQQRNQHSPRQPPPPQPQQHHPAAFASPHTASHGLPSQHPSTFSQAGPGPPGQHPPEIPYFATNASPYSTPSASGTYTAAETPELMAAAHMNRPYPPIYHNPQSNSSASVASSSGHDQHGRNMYGPPPTHLPSGMYTYPQPYPPMNPAGPSYGHQAGPPPPHAALSSQPLLMSHQPGGAGQLPHQGGHGPGQGGMTNSPRQKMSQTPLQRAPQTPLGPSSHAPAGHPPGSANSLPGSGSAGGHGVNPNAAPGPIPATTPLVVRQDNNGVQWIAFEYSRDRVKMQYTIRCDVESVNVETLSQEFKTENCVYPRACCNKDSYRGNRLNYETECNTVGWALAELNQCLRGKRGLIQRAVDSWRNSNQDPRLRSRRVRRMAKISTRKAVQQAQHPSHLAGPSGGPPAPPPGSGPTGMGTQVGHGKSGMSMSAPQLHHHHAHPDGHAPGAGEDVSADGSYHDAPPLRVGAGHTAPATDGRHRPIFHGFGPTYPADPGVAGASMPPPTYDAMDHLSRQGAGGHAAVATAATPGKDKQVALFGGVPEAKRRKFILVDDPHRGARVRVRVMLDQVDMMEIPDSYRESNSVYPRSYFPIQTQSPSSGIDRFPDDDDDEAGPPARGRTLVPVPLLDGSEAKVATPRLGRTKRRKELTLNDLGYRMSWSQSRVFAGRTMFLQKSLDAYRNKMHSTMAAAGQDSSSTAPHFETRVGKRRWLERGGRGKRGTSP